MTVPSEASKRARQKGDKPDFPRLRLAASGCLLGQPVRYNGGHAQDDFVQRLRHYADFSPFCPEAPVLGTLRETIRLVSVDGKVRVRGTVSGTDVTEAIEASCERQALAVLAYQPDGVIVKSKSPTCGLERVKLYREDGVWQSPRDPVTSGRFTARLLTAAPFLSIEEEGRLHDAWLREQFMLRVYTRARWRTFVTSASPTVAGLQRFHRRHKLILLARNEMILRRLGTLVAAATSENLSQTLALYDKLLNEAFATPSSRRRLRNVFHHVLGYFKTVLRSEEKRFYLQTLDEFIAGVVPLITVIKVWEGLLLRRPHPYLAEQIFWHPYPPELALRSAVSATR